MLNYIHTFCLSSTFCFQRNRPEAARQALDPKCCALQAADRVCFRACDKLGRDHMDVQPLLAQLERNEGHFPKAAIREAIAHREEIIPPLLEVLEAAAHDPQCFAADPKRMIHIYAMYLLAQFRETRAYPLLVRIFSTPGELPMDLAGDTVTEGLESILASVSDGDMSGMASLVENEQANEYVRSAALRGLVVLVASGRRSRDEVMAYFKGLFRTLDRTRGLVWGSLASCSADLYPEEVVEDLRMAFDEGLIESLFIGWENIEDALKAGKAAAMMRLTQRYPLIDDVEKEMAWWACFEENKERKWDLPKVRFVPPPVKARAKIGRNEPCPCGSGKKFKKCCGPRGV